MPRLTVKRAATFGSTAILACVVYASAMSADWQAAVEQVLGKPASSAGGVSTYVIPRNDIDVTVDGMTVPAAAGVESRVSFFACSCGKTRVVGQLCCTDDETNDVIDALRGGAAMEVAGLSPMFLRSRPHLQLLRFQGEGEPGHLAQIVQSALKWVQLAHSSTQPAK